MLGVEGPKHLCERATLVDELANGILKVVLAFSMVEKLYPYPRTEESGVRGPELFIISHDSCLPHLTALGYLRSGHHREYTGWLKPYHTRATNRRTRSIHATSCVFRLTRCVETKIPVFTRVLRLSECASRGA